MISILKTVGSLENSRRKGAIPRYWQLATRKSSGWAGVLLYENSTWNWLHVKFLLTKAPQKTKLKLHVLCGFGPFCLLTAVLLWLGHTFQFPWK